MAVSTRPFDMSKQLAELRHEKKNQDMLHLPSTVTIQRRPLNHAPVASPFVGANTQKVVYVSRRTPVMSAVKRVKKFLRHIENRAHQSIDMLGKNDRETLNELAEISNRLGKSSEEVLVKASGRAMEQALRVGEWFSTREQEMLCKVEIRTSSVTAIDDIVERENDDLEELRNTPSRTDQEEGQSDQADKHTNLRNNTTSDTFNDEKLQNSGPAIALNREPITDENTKPKRRKRKRVSIDKDDLPESRLRWIKTVEVAISLRG